MTVLAGLLDQLDLSDEELADAMREATARTSQGGVGPVSAGMTDFLARTTPRGRSKTTARKTTTKLPNIPQPKPNACAMLSMATTSPPSPKTAAPTPPPPSATKPPSKIPKPNSSATTA